MRKDKLIEEILMSVEKAMRKDKLTEEQKKTVEQLVMFLVDEDAILPKNFLCAPRFSSNSVSWALRQSLRNLTFYS